MKVYYIFKIKKEFVSLYKDSPSTLFHILKSIYYLDRTEVDYGYNLFRQLTLPLDKNKLDREIFIKLHQDIPYSKRKDVHFINNFYRNEVSRLTINKSYCKLEVEQNFSSFFPILEEKINNLFVCAFQKTDFFFLEDYLQELRQVS
jgi:hypothetical protein